MFFGLNHQLQLQLQPQISQKFRAGQARAWGWASLAARGLPGFQEILLLIPGECLGLAGSVHQLFPASRGSTSSAPQSAALPAQGGARGRSIPDGKSIFPHLGAGGAARSRNEEDEEHVEAAVMPQLGDHPRAH